MAKELPYFKFEPNEWENGNIQILSREHKGLFIDLCCMYWSRLGDVPYKLAVQKLCAGNATALDSLCEENIIALEEGQICIDFLNEQLDAFGNTSTQNSNNAKEGWRKRKLAKESSERNASASDPQSESDAIREEKKREEEIRKKNIDARKLKFAETLKPFLEQYGKDMINKFYSYWTEPNKSNSKFKQELQKTWSVSHRLNTWHTNNFNTKPNNNQKQDRTYKPL